MSEVPFSRRRLDIEDHLDAICNHLMAANQADRAMLVEKINDRTMSTLVKPMADFIVEPDPLKDPFVESVNRVLYSVKVDRVPLRLVRP